jgi:hypothetical protein
MAETKANSEWKERSLPPNLTPFGLAAMGEKGIEEFAKAQAELFSTLQETHRRWLHRMQSEARLASELTHRVTNARSIPDAVTACQEWTSRQLEMMAEDGGHLLAGSQKFVETGVRFLSNGLFLNEQNVSADATGERQPAPARGGQAGPATAPRQRAAARSDSFGDDASSVQSY